MMSMSFMPDSFNAPDPSKSAFLEFGHGLPTHQPQHSPGLSHNIYPVHGLQPGGHPQHNAPFQSAAYSYGRSLGYAYPGSVSSHNQNAYMPYQHSNHNSTLSHAAKVEEAGKWVICFKCHYHLASLLNRNAQAKLYNCYKSVIRCSGIIQAFYSWLLVITP